MARFTGSWKRARTGSGSLRLPSGEYISKQEQYALRGAVRRANVYAERAKEQLRRVGKVTTYNAFGTESDWALRKKSARIVGRFATRKQFTSYLRSVKRIASGRYRERQDVVYFQNYKKAVEEAFGLESKPLLNKLNRLGVNRFINAFDNDRIPELEYWYYLEKRMQEYDRLNNTLDFLLAS